uniref:Uncharacterized protein n=1 Tax=Siphoviridae sp. ctEJG5 TaxID=2827814 RepID=A0A8S5RXD4_9CAUD|nr:MAG TPA: hypothetical protein [Siphoviridae sp. ctEJG5]DAH13772.1 MAG TPA: hypothetical protein [Caudoviricetes sp.]DAI48224.1 MAG TPA: hypothetical protein [Caudoviricetes sp.]DAM11016.1 MAG TPA: hypothetical protein [Caudoviricetes sp.]DAV11892.1 MAG TPA: hypothetical protein [Caudoviricetes sp.]
MTHFLPGVAGVLHYEVGRSTKKCNGSEGE